MSGNSCSQIFLTWYAWFSCSQTVGKHFWISRSCPKQHKIYLNYYLLQLSLHILQDFNLTSPSNRKKNLDGSIFGWLVCFVFLSQDFLRAFSGLSEDFPRTIPGLSRNFLWTISEHCLDFLRTFPGLSRGFLGKSYNFLRTFSELSHDFLRTFLGFSQDCLRTC